MTEQRKIERRKAFDLAAPKPLMRESENRRQPTTPATPAQTETPEIVYLRKFINCVVFGADCSPEDIARAQAIVTNLTTALSAAEQRAEAMGRDAARYRWLREQHEGKLPLEMDADGLPMPQEVNALAFTVFYPDPTGDESLVVVPMGSLDETIDAALATGAGETGNG